MHPSFFIIVVYIFKKSKKKHCKTTSEKHKNSVFSIFISAQMEYIDIKKKNYYEVNDFVY